MRLEHPQHWRTNSHSNEHEHKMQTLAAKLMSKERKILIRDYNAVWQFRTRGSRFHKLFRLTHKVQCIITHTRAHTKSRLDFCSFERTGGKKYTNSETLICLLTHKYAFIRWNCSFEFSKRAKREGAIDTRKRREKKAVEKLTIERF